MEDQERTPFGLRLYQARTVAGYTKEAAAKAVGMKSQSTLGEAEITGKRSGYTPMLANLYGVSPIWLASGTGPMRPSGEEREPGPDYVPVTRVLLKLEAGVTGYEVQQLEGNGPPIFFRRDYLDGQGWKADKLFALKVTGDSMEPALFEGDLVMINSADTTPADGVVFAVNYEGQALIKRLRRDSGAWWLDSDNPRYTPKRCDKHAILIGRVCYRQTDKI